MTKNEILQLINDGITTKVAPFSITQVDLGNIMTEMVNLSATTFMTGTSISVSGTGLETDPFILEMTAETNTYLTEGTDISITGDGSITTPYLISFTAGTIPWSPGSSGNFSIKTDNDSTTDAVSNYAVAQGFNTLASGLASHAEGYSTTASGNYSHAEGSGTTASGNYSHAEGLNTTASGVYGASHAEGYLTTASGYASHAEGGNTIASGDGSHAEGFGPVASGEASHAEGLRTTASGVASHTEGIISRASGDYSHAEGLGSRASGEASHAGGIRNEAFSYGERATGTHGTNYTPNSTTSFDSVDRLFNIGNGINSTSRSDALTVLKDGDVGIGINNFEATTTGNKLQVSGTVYSEQYRLSALNTAPSSASDTGTLGEIRVTADYIYICTATDTWVRSALATWV